MIKRISSMLDEIETQTLHEDEEVINWGKRSKTLSEVKSAEKDK